MREMANVVYVPRTPFAAFVLTGAKHEMVEDELAAAIEQVDEAGVPIGALKGIVFLDPDHRQPAALCGEGIARAGGCLFFDQQFVTQGLPFGLRYNLRKPLS